MLKPFAELSFDYQIIRSKRKTLAIVINKSQVEVRAPANAAQAWIHDFVQTKQTWIEKKLALQKTQEAEVYQLKDKEKLYFYGQELSLKLVVSNRSSIQIDGTYLLIKHKEDADLIKLMDKFLLSQAKQLLPVRVESFTKELGLSHLFNKLKFRKTKSKWGHCTVDGVIQLNYLILLAPDFVIDYLIVHELCHLKHLNHSKAYWALVESHYPEYRTAQKWLKQHGHKLWYQ